MKPLNKPTRSPWGTVQSATARGPFWFVSTAGHGGLRVPAAFNARIPDYMRRASGWYEEDCEWSIVACVYPEHFPEEHRAHAVQTLRSWFPAAYERFTGQPIKPGESYARDQELFAKAHANDYVATAAFGEWHARVPKGMVGVVATLGGSRMLDRVGDDAWFLIPADEYEKRNHFGFIVDPTRHQRVERFA
jgi:hypothetical protein